MIDSSPNVSFSFCGERVRVGVVSLSIHVFRFVAREWASFLCSSTCFVLSIHVFRFVARKWVLPPIRHICFCHSR